MSNSVTIDVLLSDKLFRSQFAQFQSRLRGQFLRLEAITSQLGATLVGIGRDMTFAAAGMAAPFALSVRQFTEYERKMATVKAINADGEEAFKRLGDKAREMGRSTVFTASQAAEAMRFFAVGGLRANTILGAMKPTLDLAAAGQLDVAAAADITTKILRNSGIETERLGYAVDVMAKAFTTANTDLVQLGDALKYTGPIAKNAGMSFEETVAAIQLLSNAGIQGQMAGTTLRGAILQLTSPSKEAQKALKQLGVEVNDAQGNMRPLADILADMQAGTAGMGSGDRMGILGNIFQARTAAGMAELMDKSAQVRQFTESLKQAGGTAQHIADVQLDTLWGALKIVASAVQEVQISVGEALAPVLRMFSLDVIAATDAVGSWIRGNQGVVRVVALSVGIFGAAAVSTLTLGLAFKGFAGALSLAHLGFSMLPKVIGLVTTSLSLLLSPIGLGVTALGVLGAAFAYNAIEGETFGDKLITVLKGVLYGFAVVEAAVINWRATLELGFVTTKLAMLAFWQDARHTFTVAVPAYLQWFGDEFWHIMETIASYAKAAWENIIENVAQAMVAVWNVIQGQPWEFAWTPLLRGAENTIGKLPEIAERALTGTEFALSNRMDELSAQIGAGVQDRYTKLLEAFFPGPTKDKGGAATNAAPLADALGGSGAVAQSLSQSVAEIIGLTEQWDRIAKATAGEGDPAKQTAEATKQVAANTKKTTDLLDDIADATKQTPGAIQELAATLSRGVVAVLG